MNYETYGLRIHKQITNPYISYGLRIRKLRLTDYESLMGL